MANEGETATDAGGKIYGTLLQTIISSEQRAKLSADEMNNIVNGLLTNVFKVKGKEAEEIRKRYRKKSKRGT